MTVLISSLSCVQYARKKRERQEEQWEEARPQGREVETTGREEGRGQEGRGEAPSGASEGDGAGDSTQVTKNRYGVIGNRQGACCCALISSGLPRSVWFPVSVRGGFLLTQ